MSLRYDSAHYCMLTNAGDIVTSNAKCKLCTEVNTKGGTENRHLHSKRCGMKSMRWARRWLPTLMLLGVDADSPRAKHLQRCRKRPSTASVEIGFDSARRWAKVTLHGSNEYLSGGYLSLWPVDVAKRYRKR